MFGVTDTAPSILGSRHWQPEVLAGLGVNIEASPETQARCLREIGVCFSFAMRHHPAMRHAAGPRRSLGFPTIFNLLGPLTNPAGARRQLIGVYDGVFVEMLGAALARLGSVSAAVVHGAGGLDEVSTLGPSDAAWVCNGEVVLRQIDPDGIVPRASIEALQASDLQDGVGIVRAVLAGEPGPKRDIVLLNAAVALHIAGACPGISSGVEMGTDAIDSGRAARVLEDLGRLSHA